MTVLEQLQTLKRRLDAYETGETTQDIPGEITSTGKFTPNTGPQGEKGEKGERGEKGEVGPIGPEGHIGPEGKEGKAGPIGPEGKEGKEGPSGPTEPYIHNQVAEQEAANFNIAGRGTMNGGCTVTWPEATKSILSVTGTTTATAVSAVEMLFHLKSSANGQAGLNIQPIFENTASAGANFGSVFLAKCNPPEGVTLTDVYAAFYRVDTTGTGKGKVTRAYAFYVEAPVLSGETSVTPGEMRGIAVANQGSANVTAAYGLDIGEQKGSATSIGVRIAKSGTYALQLSDIGGTAAGGIEFGTDTNLHRSTAGVLRIESILDAATGYRIAGAAASGAYLRGNGTNFVSSAIQSADVAGAFSAITPGAKLEKVAALQEPEVRVESAGAVIRLIGGLKVKAGEKLVAGETVGTLPEGKRPPKLCKFGVVIGTNTPAVMSIATTGLITLSVEAAAGVEIYFDTLTLN